MLRRITVRNFLLIEELDLPLDPGLTVITGETGSGKSVLLGALGLAMGDRAEGNLQRDPAKRCVIELEVGDAAEGSFAAEWCLRNGVPQEDPMILRRQLEAGGRSRAFVNDTPVRIDQLRDLGGSLVHIHSQHQALLLHTPGFQLSLIDNFIGHGRAVAEYAGTYRNWQAAQDELLKAREQEAQGRSERDYLQFQYDELRAANLAEGEQPQLEQALSRAEHAEELAQALHAIEGGIQEEQGVTGMLAGIRQAAAKAGRIDQGVQDLLDRLHSSSVELRDIAEEAAQLAARVQLDPAEADRMRERHDLLVRLQRKHRVDDADALIGIRDGMAERIANIGSLEETVKRLEHREKDLHARVLRQAEALGAKRQKALKPLAAKVEELLKDLGIPHAAFQFRREETTPGPTGIDAVRALFSANRDRAPEPLDKVASGGELSRVMLALISLATANKDLPTVVFDEVDTGVSGETAHRVGTLLVRMALQRQVIAITHLPQIASKADTHLLVTKDHEAERVQTTIRPVAGQERLLAVARMLSGSKTTGAALENARELLGNK